MMVGWGLASPVEWGWSPSCKALAGDASRPWLCRGPTVTGGDWGTDTQLWSCAWNWRVPGSVGPELGQRVGPQFWGLV